MTSPDYTCSANAVASPAVSASGVASCTLIALPIDTYTVVVSFDPTNMYFTGPDSDAAVFNVYAPTTDKYVTGGGWIVDPSTGNKPVAISPTNNHGNTGFNVKFKQNNTGAPTGNAVYVFRGADGYDYIIKSNSWQGGALAFPGTSTASFSGKANVTVFNPATGQPVTGLGGGNYTFRIDATDTGHPGSGGWYAITVYTPTGSIYHQAGLPTSQIVLGGGKITVHSTVG
jgi:hypothetical protein